MKTGVLWIVILFLLTAACARTPDERPPDLALSLFWDTGALPPQYRYEYVITIGPGTLGQLVYQLGYGGPEAEEAQRWVTDFTLTEAELNDLYAFLKENGVFETKWKTGQPLLGGSGSSLIVTAYAKEYRMPSISELSNTQQEQADVIITGIRSYVPQAIWDEMEAWREAYQAEAE